MKNLRSFCLLVLFSLPAWAFSQTAPTDQEAYNIVQEILITMGQTRNPVKIKVLSSTGTQTAKATKDAYGDRVILYNRGFLSEFNQGGISRQRAYLIMAHEVAHHLNNDDFNTIKAEQRREMENNADEFAGRLLYKLCIAPKDVASVFQSLPPDPWNDYLPPNQRMMTVMKGYEFEKANWESVGKDPCKGEPMEPPMNLHRRLKGVKSEGVSARIFHDSILIRYNVYPLKNETTFEGRFVISNKAKVAPSINNFKWITPPNTYGMEKSAVWYFKKDGFSYQEVFNGDNFGLAVFSAGNVPRQPRKWLWWVGGALAAGGAVLLASGIPDRLEAQNDYDQYKSITNPNTFKSITGMSRQEAYDQFNPVKKSSEWRIGIGLASLGAGAWILLDTNKKRRNFPKDIFLFPGVYR